MNYWTQSTKNVYVAAHRGWSEKYPENTIDDLSAAADVSVLDAARIATELGNAKAMNIVLLGALIRSLQLENIDWDSILERLVKPAFLELNKKALRQGMEAVL